jgi:glycosyltransferase involved in cell wall biosynthesis
VSVARNFGAEKATSDLLLFLDADDGLLPNYLSEIKNLIIEFPKAGIYATNKYDLKGQFEIYVERVVDFMPEKKIISNYFKTVIENSPLLGPVYVVRKNVFRDSGGFVPGMIRGQDTYLQSLILLQEKLCFLNKPLYFYRLDANNMATEEYTPPTTNRSLLDHINNSNTHFDIYAISYSLNQVEQYIESGYKTYAADWLKQVSERTPKKYRSIIEERRSVIDQKFKTPVFYFKLRKNIIRSLIILKDKLQITFFNKQLFKDFHSGSLKL